MSHFLRHTDRTLPLTYPGENNMWFINNLSNLYQNVHTLIYADDVVILREEKTISEISTSLTCALSFIQSKSCLLWNTKKTVCMMFSKCQLQITNSNVLLNGEELGTDDEFKP